MINGTGSPLPQRARSPTGFWATISEEEQLVQEEPEHGNHTGITRESHGRDAAAGAHHPHARSSGGGEEHTPGPCTSCSTPQLLQEPWRCGTEPAPSCFLAVEPLQGLPVTAGVVMLHLPQGHSSKGRCSLHPSALGQSRQLLCSSTRTTFQAVFSKKSPS